MGHRSAVRARPLPELSDLLVRDLPPAVPSLNRGRGLLGLTGALMGQHGLVFALVHVPGGLLDVLGHVGQVHVRFLLLLLLLALHF